MGQQQQPQPLDPPRRNGLALMPAVAIFTTGSSTAPFLLLGLLDLRFQCGCDCFSCDLGFRVSI